MNAQIVNGNKTSKLLVSILLDNSSSMNGEHIQALKAALSRFNETVLASGLKDSFEYAVTVFEGLGVKVAKPYDQHSFNSNEIAEGGLALWNKSISFGLKDLTKRLNTLSEAGLNVYKPWLIVLSNGQCYDSVDRSLEQLKAIYQTRNLTYFPFALSHARFDENLDGLRKLKKPIVILNNQYDDFFEWLFNTVKQRLMIPIEESMKLKSNCFDGWAEI